MYNQSNARVEQQVKEQRNRVVKQMVWQHLFLQTAIMSMLRNRAPPMATCHKEEALLADISKIPSAPESDVF